MGYDRQYHFESDPYCYCCGSRQAMTLDAYMHRFQGLPHTHAFSIASMAFFSVWDGEVAS